MALHRLTAPPPFADETNEKTGNNADRDAERITVQSDAADNADREADADAERHVHDRPPYRNQAWAPGLAL
jgi:hypothetical protein